MNILLVLLCLLPLRVAAKFLWYSNEDIELVEDEDIIIRWDTNWPAWGSGPESSSLLDLWITGYDDHTLKLRIGEFKNVREGGSTNWTVSMPDKDSPENTTYVFRFKENLEPGESGTGWHYTSYPPFKMVRPSPSVSSTSSTLDPVSSTFATSRSSTSASASASLSTTPSLLPTNDLAPSSIPADEDLGAKKTNKGAIAGGVVGGLAAVLIALALWWLLARRRKSKSLGKELYTNGSTSGRFQTMDMPLGSATAENDLPEWVHQR